MKVHWVKFADVDSPIKFLEVLPADEEAAVVRVGFDLIFFSKLGSPLSRLLRPGSFPHHIPPRIPKSQHSLIFYLVYAKQ